MPLHARQARRGCHPAVPDKNSLSQNDRIMVINNLGFSYHKQKILFNISFSVSKGQICGLLGPNGSGKTTLLKCMNGILKPDTGNVSIHKRRLTELSREEIAKSIAAVPQELKVVFSFTVIEIVLMGGSGRFGLAGTPKAQDRRQAGAVLEELGIGHLAQRCYNDLSGGEKQMVLIARALFQEADILLLDEPISHLDFKRQHMIMELIRRITRERNLAILITLHDPNIAGRYCDRLIMLNRGRILHQGARDNIFHAKSLGSVYGMRIKIERTGIGTPFAFPDDTR
jgi:iron complex transport system ATP-binding protein